MESQECFLVGLGSVPDFEPKARRHAARGGVRQVSRQESSHIKAVKLEVNREFFVETSKSLVANRRRSITLSQTLKIPYRVFFVTAVNARLAWSDRELKRCRSVWIRSSSRNSIADLHRYRNKSVDLHNPHNQVGRRGPDWDVQTGVDSREGMAKKARLFTKASQCKEFGDDRLTAC